MITPPSLAMSSPQPVLLAAGLSALWPLAAAPVAGLTLRALLRLVYGARGPGRRAPAHAALLALSSILLFSGLLVPGMALLLGPGGLLWLVMLHALVEWRLARRDLQRRSIWSLIVRTQARRRPLAPILRLCRERYSGFAGRSYRQLSEAIDRGVPLSEALAAAPRSVPRSALPLVSLLGDRPWALPAAGGEATAGAAPQETPKLSWPDAGVRLPGEMPSSTRGSLLRLGYAFSYFATVVSFAVVGVTGIMIFIVPNLRDIFEEFEMPVPPLTKSVIAASAWAAGPLAFAAGPFTLAVLGVLVALGCYAFDVPVMRWLTDRLFWFRHRAAVLDLLAEASDRGMTFADALDRLANRCPGYPSGLVRGRLRRAHQRQAAGGRWVDALCRARLIRRCDAPALEAARGAGNLAWVLRRLAEENLTQGVYRLRAAGRLLLPACVIGVGVAVGWLVIGLFLPLPALIEGLA